MLLRSITIENVRSFLQPQKIKFQENLSIVIGPNGGGKTNLLDILSGMLRRYLFATRYFYQTGGGLWRLDWNNTLDRLTFENHSKALSGPQLIEIEVVVTSSDIENMKLIKEDAGSMEELTGKKFQENPFAAASSWDLEKIAVGDVFSYALQDGNFQHGENPHALSFLEYLRLYEIDKQLRSEMDKTPLQLPIVYLPVTRTSTGFSSQVVLANYDDNNVKKENDSITSRNGAANLIQMAIGRLARRYRDLQEDSNQNAKEKFYQDANLVALSTDLKELGYTWELDTLNRYSNQYDIKLTKQGTSFSVYNASSGEKELLTYLFAIHALNVRNAVIIVDEPELHLHPKWQKALLKIWEKLAKETGNQFVLATHSPTFISPDSIKYVTRVYSEDQQSKVVQIEPKRLVNPKQLFNIVNSQNNEKMFFADRVILVEGLSDRIFFERVFDNYIASKGISNNQTLEIISVGGKGLFAPYQKLLSEFKVKNKVIADLDYIEQIGDSGVKQLFVVNNREIKKDVIENIKSMDADKLAATIEDAITSGDWKDSQDVWEYIKSHRRKLKSDLNDKEAKALNKFIGSKIKEGLFLLGRGSLEDYLPEGLKSKDLEKLIEYVKSDDFFKKLSKEVKVELDQICEKCLND
jgi:putative ATP-dependent endonuclease of the OLD family